MPLVTVTSPHSVTETVERITAALANRGLRVLGHVDHGAGAREVGLELGEEQLLIFGDARVGTLLMQEDPEIGYELPLRLLVWDAGGQTTVGYRPPTELSREFSVAAHADVLERMQALLAQLVAEGTAA